MEEIALKGHYNKILLVFGLLIFRLPRLFALDNNPWVLILTLAPFWYVVINNHLAEIKIKPHLPRALVKYFFQIVILFNIAGILVLVSAVFVKAFIDERTAVFVFAAYLMLGVFLVGFLWGFSHILKRLELKRENAILGVLYFAVTLVSVLRSSIDNPFHLLFVFQIITFLIFAFSAKFSLKHEDRQYLVFLAAGLLLYLALNVILEWFGFVNQSENYLRDYDAVMLSYLGVKTTRVYFPMVEGINAFGMVAGIGISFCGALFILELRNKSVRWIRLGGIILGAILSIYVVLRTDSRGGLLFGVVSAGLVLLFPYLKHRLFSVILVLFPVVILALGSRFVQSNPFLEQFARPGSDILSGRSAIWDSGISHFATFEPVHLIGYGLYGQIKSGVVQQYQAQFESYLNAGKMDLHHYTLQAMIDIGYIGLIIALFWFYSLGINLQRKIRDERRGNEAYLGLVGLIYIVLIGSVSSVPAFYNQELFYLLPFLWAESGKIIE